MDAKKKLPTQNKEFQYIKQLLLITVKKSMCHEKKIV